VPGRSPNWSPRWDGRTLRPALLPLRSAVPTAQAGSRSDRRQAGVEVKDDVARSDSVDRDLSRWDAAQRGCVTVTSGTRR
jgi:hypothetical protein